MFTVLITRILNNVPAEDYLECIFRIDSSSWYNFPWTIYTI